MVLLRILHAALLVPLVIACREERDSRGARGVFDVQFGSDSIAVARTMSERGLRPVAVSNTGAGRFMLFAGERYLWLGSVRSPPADSSTHVVVALSDSGTLAGVAVSADYPDSTSALSAFSRLSAEGIERFGAPTQSASGRLYWELGDSVIVNAALRDRVDGSGRVHVAAFTVTDVRAMARRPDLRE
jgi:hypothetical protein